MEQMRVGGMESAGGAGVWKLPAQTRESLGGVVGDLCNTGLIRLTEWPSSRLRQSPPLIKNRVNTVNFRPLSAYMVLHTRICVCARVCPKHTHTETRTNSSLVIVNNRALPVLKQEKKKVQTL